MNHNFNNNKSPHMNYAFMKYRLTNTVNNLNGNQKEREAVSSVVSSFRQDIPKQKDNSTKYKTSKNSRKKIDIYSIKKAERGTDRSTTSKAKNHIDNMDEGSLSKKTSSVNGSNSRFVLSTTTKSKDKGFECLLKKKIIKMKEKNKDKFNTNLHAQTNYLSKIKNKITLDTSHHIKLTQNSTSNKINQKLNTQSQKRSNSTLDDEDKYERPPTQKILFNILTNPCVITHNHFNHAKDLKKVNLVSSSKINSILNANKSQGKKPYNLHFDFNNNTSKTSFPTKHNSRKQSIDKMITVKPQINNKFRGSAIKMQCKAKIITEGTPNLINKKEENLHLKVLSEIRYDSCLKKPSNHSAIKDLDSDLWNILKKSINKDKTTNNEINEAKKNIKAKVPLTTSHSPNELQSQEIQENGRELLIKKRRSLKLSNKTKDNTKKQITEEYSPVNYNTNQNLPCNISIDSMHSTIRESRYYLQEMDYLSNYIRQCKL